MNFQTTCIGNLVSEHRASVEVFDKLKIDYYSDGTVTLDQVIKDYNIDASFLENEITKSIGNESDHVNYGKLSLTELIDIIRFTCHKSLRDELPVIKDLSYSVVKHHGEKYPYFHELHDWILLLISELMPHLLTEEKALFPYIQYMELALQKGKKPKPAAFGKLTNYLKQLDVEHHRTSETFESIRKLTNNYSHPENASEECISLFDNLKYQENQIHWHLHLENNLLFYKAVEIEQKLTQL